MVVVQFWAAAADAAGTRESTIPAGLLHELIANLEVAYGPRLSALLRRSLILLDGARIDRAADVMVASGSVLEILPPFAGG